MKRLKKVLVLALAACMLLGLCACGGSKEDSSMLGTYTLYAMDYDADTVLLADDLFEGESYVTLKSGGSAEMCMEDDTAAVKWKADGTALTLSAADGDMTGTLANGILTLDMEGTNLYFAADGADTKSIGAISLDDMLNGVFEDTVNGLTEAPAEKEVEKETKKEAPAKEKPEPEPVAAAPAEDTEVQKLWNGWWYGCIDVNGCDGGWEWLNGYYFDITMYVDLDADGEGSLVIFEPYGQITDGMEDNAFAFIDCHADTRYLYGDSGTCFEADINTSDWVFVRALDNPDKIMVGSSFTDDDGDRFGYDLTFMPWGSRWENEERVSKFIPNFTDYIACLDDGMTDPGAPGTASGAAESGKDAEAPAQTASGGEKSPLLGKNPVKLSINDRDIVYVYYPGDRFEYNKDYGKIKSTEGGASILFDPMLGATNYEEYRTAYQTKYKDEDDYSLIETTVNGYPALVMKYSDWLGSSMYVDVDFGGSHDGYYGMCFNVSANSLDECDTDLVWAIIESFEFAD